MQTQARGQLEHIIITNRKTTTNATNQKQFSSLLVFFSLLSSLDLKHLYAKQQQQQQQNSYSVLFIVGNGSVDEASTSEKCVSCLVRQFQQHTHIHTAHMRWIRFNNKKK